MAETRAQLSIFLFEEETLAATIRGTGEFSLNTSLIMFVTRTMCLWWSVQERHCGWCKCMCVYMDMFVLLFALIYKIWTSGLCPEIKMSFSRFLPKLGICLYYSYQHRDNNHLRKMIFKKALKHIETHNISIKTNMLPLLACLAHVPLVQWYPSAACGPAPVKQTWKIRLLPAQIIYIFAVEFLVLGLGLM